MLFWSDLGVLQEDLLVAFGRGRMDIPTEVSGNGAVTCAQETYIILTIKYVYAHIFYSCCMHIYMCVKFTKKYYASMQTTAMH